MNILWWVLSSIGIAASIVIIAYAIIGLVVTMLVHVGDGRYAGGIIAFLITLVIVAAATRHNFF